MDKLILGESLEALIDNRGRNPKFSQKGVPVISAKVVLGGYVDTSTTRTISTEAWREWMPVSTARHDVILTSEAPLGRCALIRDDAPYALAQRVFGLRGKKGVLDSRYLYYALQSQPVQSQLISRSSGTTVLGIKKAELVKIEIPNPGFIHQKKIANTLGALDDKITANERIMTTYEATFQAKFDLLTADPQTGKANGTPVTKLIEFNPKTAKPEEELAVYVDMASLPTNRALISSWDHRKPKSGSKFVNGDTLLARITPCLENGKTGHVDFMHNGQIGTGSTEFIVMRPLPGVPKEFGYFLARNMRFRSHAIQKMAGTSGRQRVSAADASNFFIRQPTKEELKDFGDEAGKAFAHMKSLANESRTLTELRDTLLPQLMSGKLRVKDAEKIVEDNE